LSAPARESVPPADHSFSRAGADNEAARDYCSRSESWDLDFWLARTPEERLDACMALREDVEKVVAARASVDRRA
jgi:hypothetical protein